MEHRGWILLFLSHLLLLSPASGGKPWEDPCPKPKPGKVRGHCSHTCLGGKWRQPWRCSAVDGVETCGEFCGIELCSVPEWYFCSVDDYGLTYNYYYNECVPEDWTCPEGDWTCQDPCLYSCDNSSDTSMCQVLNRRTGEVGKCSKEGWNHCDPDLQPLILRPDPEWPDPEGPLCWDTPEECEPCWKKMSGAPGKARITFFCYDESGKMCPDPDFYGHVKHEDPTKYYICAGGYPDLYECPPWKRIFDEAQGTCVSEEQSSSILG